MQAPQTSTIEYQKHPEGSARLVCSRIIDKGSRWDEAKQKDVRKITLFFESEILMPEDSGDYAGQPFLVTANYTYSMYLNSLLCKFIQAWIKPFKNQEEANSFDIASLIGMSGFASIVYNDKWVNIGTMMPLPANMEPLKIIGKTFVFDMENPDMKIFDGFSEKMQAYIKEAKEWDIGAHGEPDQTPPVSMVSSHTGQPVAPANAKPADGPAPTGEFDEEMDDIPF